MAYYVRYLAWKKSAPQWKIQFLSYKKKDAAESHAKKPKKEWDIPRDRLRSLGFHRLMTLEEARARARQLNSQALLAKQEERIRKAALDRKQTALRYNAILPDEFVTEFELRFVRSRDSQTEAGRRKTTQTQVLWKAAQRMIFTLQIEPSEWFYSFNEIYDYFCQNQYSLRYSYSILKIANLWGFFYSRKLARPFLPVPLPRGYERQRIIEAFYRKKKDGRRASAPLSPAQLETARGKLNQPNFNWLCLSVWFGLRPKEVDNLQTQELWRIETMPTGRKVLWVFQTKIIALPPEDRWKPIPILFEEQEFALRILQSKNFNRPLVRTVHNYFGPHVDLYGGRKGFTDLMLSRGQILENVSTWMGHSSLDRTWRSYKSRTKFHLP